MTVRLLVALAALSVGAGLAPEIASAQCAMCRTALEQNPEAAAGFNRAIGFLLVMPYLVFGGLAAFVFRSWRKRTAGGVGAPAADASGGGFAGRQAGA